MQRLRDRIQDYKDKEEEAEPQDDEDDVNDEEVEPEEEQEEEDEGSEDEEGSGPRCFIDPVFADAQIQVMEDIQYGSAFNAMTGQQQDLMLDAYLPPDSDSRD